MMRRFAKYVLTLALLGTPGLLTAQGGVSIWALRGTLPDTVQQAAQGLISTFDLQITMGTDGKRVSMTVAPGPEMIAGSLTTDLSTVQMQVVMSSADDTMHIGVVLPPDVAAMMGGGLGFRMDVPVPAALIESMVTDSMLDAVTRMTDSINAETTKPEFSNTGRTDTVAGMSCEVWTMTSSSDEADTLEMCLAPQPPAMKAMADAMGTRFASLIEAFEKLGSEMENPFGDRNLMVIRFQMLGETDITFELVSITEGTPGPAFFELPAGLEPFPMEMLQGMLGAAGQPTET